MSVRPVLAVLLFLLPFVAWAAQEGVGDGEAAKLPRACQQIIDQGVAEIGKARQQYEKAAKPVVDKVVAMLKQEQDAATKAGQLDLAVSLKKRLEEIVAGDLVDLADHQARSARSGTAQGGEINPRKAIIGTWSWNLLKVKFTSDGLATILGMNLLGTWSLDKNGRSLRLSWGGQNGDILDFVTADTLCVTNHKGEKTYAKRVVE